jgi:hypothetical protein
VRPYTPPNHCEDCGAPFPWTVEKRRAAAALIEELDDFTADDRQKIKQSLDDIAHDSAATSLAVIRLRKWFRTTTDAVGQALWKAAMDIGTEAAKKALLNWA